MLVICKFHPFERFALEVGRNLRGLDLEGVEVIEFTPTSVGEIYRNYDDWYRIGSIEQSRRSAEGRKELKTFVKGLYEEVGLVLELHDDPIEVVTHGYVSFPAWNVKLRRVVNDFEEKMKRHGYVIYANPSSPYGRSYHHAVLEYFPYGAGERGDLTKSDGIFIAKELTEYIRRDYLGKS